MNISAEEIMRKAAELGKGIENYYTLSESKVYKGKELIEHSILEEYVANGKRKIVTNDQLLGEDAKSEAWNDGEKVIIYDKHNGRAFKLDIAEDENIQSLDPKEKINNVMGIMNGSHEFTFIGEETILDFDTVQIDAKAKTSNHLFGDTVLWVDKKTGFIIKMISNNGGVQTEMQYKEIDFSPEFPEDAFTLNIPEGVEIKDLEAYAPDTVTLEGAEEILEQSFYLFSEKEFNLKDVEIHHIEGEITRDELNLTYYSKEDAPMFYLTIFHSPEGMKIEKADLKIRGKQAKYEKIVNSITWDEDGLRYAIILINPDIEKEEIIKKAESMVLSSNLNRQSYNKR
ncbi:hypothetical protein [Oceanobacillus sp. FSL K6-3682]|uniref:LolA family protein n=1 Tax=Oceanobacillus sp. FSL K6-3682 TaxID=2921503 RepID=UPI000AF207CB